MLFLHYFVLFSAKHKSFYTFTNGSNIVLLIWSVYQILVKHWSQAVPTTPGHLTTAELVGWRKEPFPRATPSTWQKPTTSAASTPAMAAVSGSTIFNSNVEVAIKFSKQLDYFRIEYDIFQSSKIVKFVGSTKKRL